MKVMAMYLPQFHRVRENDEWWGEGFTEWTNVKKAQPLFTGHYQPRIPLDENYYDLSKKGTIIDQMRMAKNNCVDVFCIYHYWFRGRQLLEKPAELLVKENELPIEFCFCWANESWTRTWDGNDGAKEILISQDYGDKSDWKKHYDYLRIFFCHKNYLKLGNRPVFMIYKPMDSELLKDIFCMWNELAIRDGFDGIYMLSCYRNLRINTFPLYGDALYDFEPFATLSSCTYSERAELSSVRKGFNGKNYTVIDYEGFMKKMVFREYLFEKCHNRGIFVGWDNTARRGDNTELIFENCSPDVFKISFEKLYCITMQNNNDFIVINAWNEWGEGTYLEPDTRYGMEYLRAIRDVREKYAEF